MIAQPTPRDLVLGFLSDADRDEILAGGRPSKWEGGSASSGPLRPQVMCRSFGLEVQQYTPEAWETHVAWHTYWRQHGYHTIDEELAADAPPRPSGDRELLRITWGQIRQWISDVRTPAQLELELAA